MRRVLRALLIAVPVLLVVIQVVRPDRTNPPVDPARTLEASVKVPPDVQAILDRSCRDCHSNRTRWPWYSHVAPASWLLAYHVREGREHLNLSEWADYDAEDQADVLKEVCEEVEKGNMPLPSYVPLHPEATLTPADAQAICRWTEEARK